MTDSPILEVAVRISKALLWLFTTRIGLECLAGAFLLFLIVRFMKALRDRSLLLTAAGKKPGIIRKFLMPSNVSETMRRKAATPYRP